MTKPKQHMHIRIWEKPRTHAHRYADKQTHHGKVLVPVGRLIDAERVLDEHASLVQPYAINLL